MLLYYVSTAVGFLQLLDSACVVLLCVVALTTSGNLLSPPSGHLPSSTTVSFTMQLALVAVMVTIASVTAFSPIPPRRSTTPNAVVLASTARDGAEVEGAVVSIRYCTGCNWMHRATWMTQELLTTFDDESISMLLYGS